MPPLGSLNQTDFTCTFKWKIPHFLRRPEMNGDCIWSPTFSVVDDKNVSGACYLALYPRGQGKNAVNNMDIIIYNVSDTMLTLSYELSIEDKDGYGLMRRTLQNKEIKKNGGLGFRFFDFNEQLQKKIVETLLSDGSLTVRLDIVKPGPESPTSCLVNDLGDSFIDMKFSDLQIVCHGQKFACHRFLLAARSPVLNSMFTSGFKESTGSEITLDFMKPEILKVNFYSL